VISTDNFKCDDPLEHFSKYCSLHKKHLPKTKLLSVRPEPVEGPTFRSWFDKLTTNGIAMYGEFGYKIKKNALQTQEPGCRYL